MKKESADPLSEAALKGDLKSIQVLLAQQAGKKNQKSLDTALGHAVKGAQIKAAELLLNAGANPNSCAVNSSLLIDAAESGELEIVKLLVKAGADVHRKVAGADAFAAALEMDQVKVAEFLKSRGADWATSTLRHACEHGDLKRACLALDAGADVESKGQITSDTPLTAAAGNGHTQLVRLLLKRGANPNARIEGKSALHDAAMHGGNLETVNELAEAGANVNADWCGETVLMAAAAGGNLPIVKRLIELGAKLAARDKSRGMSVMDHAKASKNKELIAYLKTLGAAADRDAPRALARSLARKYGGKPVEHVAGFMLNAKFHGQSCQFNIGTEGLSLFVRGLDYGAPEFKRSKDGQLILATAKPNNQRLKFEAVVRGAGDKAGLVVFRTLGVSPLPEAFVKSFYSDHIKHFEQLRLSKQETVNLGSNSAGFSCSRVDVAFVEQRLEAFAQLIHKISRPPQPERTWFDGERLMKSGPRTGAASSHQFGGTYEQPIACPQCGCATNLMVRVDFSDPLLPKTMLGRDQFPVFWCLACLEWDPVFYELPSPTPQALNKSGQRLKPLKVKQGEEDLPARVLTLVPVASGKKAGRKSKLGGKPTWIQMDQTPDCPKCENPMAFVLQLASDSRISYGDMGMLYSFVCPECHVSAALIQSH